MTAPTPGFLLVCPTCGKKYQGDASKPNARYKCPADQADLIRAEAPAVATPKSVPTPLPTQPIAPPQQTIATDAAMTAVLGSAGAAAAMPKSDPQRTRPLGSSDETVGSSVVNRTPTSDDRRSVLAALKPGAHVDQLHDTKYEVVGKLGQGGVGEVLKVIDRDLKREVAMKMLLPRAAETEDSLIRFIEEAQATGQLEHPNIVPVHDLGLDRQGRVYFTLKFVQGVPLKHVIAGRADNAQLPDGSGFYRERYSPLRMIEILIAMCQAVAYAHSKGIIHRDLKPDNVMLGKFGEVLVMDWGLAKVLGKDKTPKESPRDTVRVMTSRSDDASQNTMEGAVAGTPAYMSPEQAAGRVSELDQRTDIYALGAILYEILSGEPPYRGPNALAVVKQVVDAGPSPLKQGTFGFDPLPRELKAICDKAMARKPQDRYATASLLRDDLQAYLENQPVSAAPDNAVQRAIKWIRRNQRQVKTSALSAAAVIALVTFTWLGWRTYRVRSLTNEAVAHLTTARDNMKRGAERSRAILTSGDPYAAQSATSFAEQRNRAIRKSINDAIDPLRRALELDANNSRVKLLLAESYMELWRLAVAEGNSELARSHRRDIELFAPPPSPFSDELNGFGSLKITFDPPSAEAFIFSFEPLVHDDTRLDLPPRLIPVPYDWSKRSPDAKFIEAERERTKVGDTLPSMTERHSIFNLDATPESKLNVSGGAVNVEKLPPGSYMLLARAPGHIEIRVPIRIGRGAKVDRRIAIPRVEDVPEGFFFMAGGEIMTGGTTAGAPAPSVRNIPPSLIYHDEITIAEYAEFIVALARSGRQSEARARLPKDFGVVLATLDARGNLVPPGGYASDFFSNSPVRGVSYNDALAYIAWQSERDGLPYRLPKDWEWEAACRGADGRTYSWGNQPGKGLAVVTQGYGDTGANMSWKWENYKDESPWGIHNLAGGAAEWTMSKFDPNAKPEDPVFGQLAIRGNAWALPPVGLECAFRTSGQPDYFHPTIGFRMALDYPIKRAGAAAAQVAQAAAHH
jgi:eukaryotic-like serine/threonine-protein kinase